MEVNVDNTPLRVGELIDALEWLPRETAVVVDVGNAEADVIRVDMQIHDGPPQFMKATLHIEE